MINKITWKVRVIILSVVLLFGISTVSSIQIEIYGQQQVQQQKADINTIINQIAQRVSSADPTTNSTQVQQVLVQLFKHTTQISDKTEASIEISQIASEVAKHPNGIVSQLLSHYAKELTLAVGANGYDDALIGDMSSLPSTLADGYLR
jgi:hypothetical protein